MGLDDRYLPGPETPAGQEIRFAAGLADWLRAPRRLRGFGGPMIAVLIALVAVAIAVVLTTVL